MGILLDTMVEGREYESLLTIQPNTSIDILNEFRTIINTISKIRQCPTICYLANVVNQHCTASISIEANDDLPFSEMIDQIDENEKSINIILITPGGSAEQVARFVDKLRKRFEYVTFILPSMAMSAGTIFALSGDELIMDARAYIGPIDPQVRSKDGSFLPAQAILTLVDDIKNRGMDNLNDGRRPDWTDVQILNNIDAKELGNAISASAYSIQLVTEYLEKYKFKTWTKHSDGNVVTDADRRIRAKEIATQLCDHKLWKTHSRGISREIAHKECRLKITHPEHIKDLNSAIRKFRALSDYSFERTNIAKAFLSLNYSLFRNFNPPSYVLPIGTFRK